MISQKDSARRTFSVHQTLAISSLCLIICLITSVDLTFSQSLSERLKQHVSILAADSLDGRGLGTPGKEKATDYIVSQFEHAGLEPLSSNFRQRFFYRVQLVNTYPVNVAGVLRGSDPNLSDEYIVLGAHYDHVGYEYTDGERVVFNGADDNASGTAVLIELAHYFAAHRELIGRSIIFVAFDAEESGLVGAQRFVDDHTHLPIKSMFSLDMLGMYESNKGLDMKGMGSIDNGVEIATELASRHNVTLRNLSVDIEARTDTWPFGQSGIPAVHPFTGLNSPYHKPEDTWEKLEYEGMEKVVTYLGYLISELSMLPELKPSHRFEALQSPYALRYRSGALLYFGGSHHAYPDEFFSANYAFSFATGFYAQLHVGQNLVIQPELLYDFNGSKSPAGTLRRHAFTVPVNVQYNAVNEAGLVRAYPFGGVYYRYAFAGKDGDIDLDFDALHRNHEFGINMGFGVDVMKVQVNTTWRRALTNIHRSGGPNAFDSGWFISVGYRFGGGL
jgi:aminopeptidase YwaD